MPKKRSKRTKVAKGPRQLPLFPDIVPEKEYIKPLDLGSLRGTKPSTAEGLDHRQGVMRTHLLPTKKKKSKP